MKNIAIIGAGASGISAAIEALRTARETGVPVQVTVYEKLPRICKKILVTGNGRCNLSNRNIALQHYRGNKALVSSVLENRFSDSVGFFSSMSLLTKEESGRIYPKSGNASSVADALRYTCLSLGCKIAVNTPVTEIKRQNGGFLLNSTEFSDVLILACGGAASPVFGSDGSGYELLKMLGHKVTKIRPALNSVKCKGSFLKSLKGIRTDASAVLLLEEKAIFEDAGEIQFTHYGLSGIPIFNLSGLIDNEYAERYKITLDLCREMTPVQLNDFFVKAFKIGKPCAADVLSGLLPKRLGEVVLKRCGISPAEKPEELTVKECAAVAYTLKNFESLVIGTKGFSDAQVTSGGVASEEIDLVTLSSRIADGLYICGELLDADGICGGYNLHFAWTSGRTAGYNAVAGIMNNDKSK